MSSPPGVGEALNLLDALRSAIDDAVAREQKLNGDFQLGSASLRRSFEFATRKLDAKLQAQLESEEAGYLKAGNDWESRFQRRKTAINRAHMAVHNAALAKISAQEEQNKSRAREGLDEAENRRDAGLARAASDLDSFQQKLAASGENIARLETEARKSFRGYHAFRKLLAPDRPWPRPDPSRNENDLFEDLQKLESKTRLDLGQFGGFPAPRIFRLLPAWILVAVLLAVGAAACALPRFGIRMAPDWVGGAAFAALALVIVVHWLGKRSARTAAEALAEDVGRSRSLLDAAHERSLLHHRQEERRIKDEFEATIDALNQAWKRRTKQLLDERGAAPAAASEKVSRISRKNEELHGAGLARLKESRNDALARIRREAAGESERLAARQTAKAAELETNHKNQWAALEGEWKAASQRLFTQIKTANDSARSLFPDWDLPCWEGWAPPVDFKNAAKFGRLDVDLEELAAALPKDPRLVLPAGPRFSLPLSLVYPLQGSLLFETSQTGQDEAIQAINNVIFRLISVTPPGKFSLTIFDPVGLGENFAALMHLADFEERSINSRIWTQQTQFEEKLGELNEHMEKVIQMYLRNEYATIAEYNAQAGTIAEKYHFLVIASFPVNFSDMAARRLRNIAASGARCGVYTLIHWDRRHDLPKDFIPDELRKNSVCLVHGQGGFTLSGRGDAGTQVALDPPPSPEFATRFLNQAGRLSKDSSRVEVPFEQVAPAADKIWTEQTIEELTVPIGRSGATKLQYLEIGKGTRQHALIAGKTGSGKSTLFHVIITNLALWCSPEQVEFYLVDFKKGVEFKCYAQRKLPHAKVVAIESDRPFGLSVLQRVDEELRRRGDLFRQIGAQDLGGYKRAGGKEPIPRLLLIIDEFQEFFVEEDRVSQGAAVLLDRIVRQGRAFGIHVLLGSQTLGGAYTLARATIGQMVIRIALQCNEADAYLIMDQDNPAPRLLSRPGEGIYNDTAGSIEGNSPFQAVWLSDRQRDEYLGKIRACADKDGNAYPGPFVFEGNAPADARENLLLRAALETVAARPPSRSRIWLGSPNSIKGPTEAAFQRLSGNNLLLVGQSEERTMTILSLALAALAAEYPAGAARFIILDSTPPGFPQKELLRRIVQAVPHEVVEVNNSNLGDVLGGLAARIKDRTGGERADAPETFILIQGLQNFRKLRQEDEFSLSSRDPAAGPDPAAALQDLISDGPAQGIHVIAACDTYNNLHRSLGRKALTEFEWRVLFQMSAADSASLIDAPDASTLGFHRALLYNNREGYIETFRPYAQPDEEWLQQTVNLLRRRALPTQGGR